MNQESVRLRDLPLGIAYYSHDERASGRNGVFTSLRKISSGHWELRWTFAPWAAGDTSMDGSLIYGSLDAVVMVRSLEFAVIEEEPCLTDVLSGSPRTRPSRTKTAPVVHSRLPTPTFHTAS